MMGKRVDVGIKCNKKKGHFLYFKKIYTSNEIHKSIEIRYNLPLSSKFHKYQILATGLVVVDLWMPSVNDNNGQNVVFWSAFDFVMKISFGFSI